MKQRHNTLSSREIRRMNEREQRRQNNIQAVNAFWNLPPEERQRRIEDDKRLRQIQRNGITIEDLNDTAQEGYRDGAKVAAENTMRNIYAAVALVLREKLKYGQKRCKDFLNAVDQKVIYALDSDELVKQVWDETGLQLRFSEDTFTERVQDKNDD